MRLYGHTYRTLTTGRNFLYALTLAALPFFFSCSEGAKAPSAQVDTPRVLESKTGRASYYAKHLHGDETASGETFDNTEMVAAHPTYPLGTIVRVKNLENDSTVRVRINDRGPSDDNREEGVIIDLSRRAARKLGMMHDGRVKVRVDVLQWGNDKRE
ncbi:septal ring lytic transglycosylase RlpA family protein [Paraflavisolibacter sp. H34]|uniref:septal ring lytic transglycosylase RlpA family protein n=1 Tax=Huijunlia imazamoxiresistens TaxID=3127457 RepID=UPI003015F8C5